jgi:hypothetical protein
VKLLAVVGLVGLFSALSAIFVEHRSAVLGLKAFRGDLQKYADTLSKDDINEIERMESLKSASKAMNTALSGIIVVSVLFQIAVWFTIDRVSNHHWNLLWR